MSHEHYKYQRLFIDCDLKTGQAPFELDKAQAHYLVNVLRKQAGDKIRVFNGRDGEFFAVIESANKKSATVRIDENIRLQPLSERQTHLIFAPLKKNRMDIVIEKCTELGVTDFHPVITERTEVRTLKRDRLESQIIEACEQSERLSVPVLHDLVSLPEKIQQWPVHYDACPVFAAIERVEAKALSDIVLSGQSNAFLVGPVGGFHDKERAFLTQSDVITPITLGENILRAETACVLCVSSVFFSS